MSEYETHKLIVKPGKGVLIEVELRHRGPEKTTTGEVIVKQTVNHQPVTEYDELSICGEYSGGGGQCVEGIRALFLDNADVLELCAIWDRWHLNDLRPGCAHQKQGNYDDPAISGQVCKLAGAMGAGPNAWGAGGGTYKYGSAWLVEPLPAEVKARVIELCTAINLGNPGGRGGAKDAAVDFLTVHGLEIAAAFKGDKCPPFCAGGDHIHGKRYRVTIKRKLRDVMPSPSSISFDFWNSHHDAGDRKAPSAYDILACISSDASSPTDPVEVAREFGYSEDSRKDWAICKRVAEFAVKLQNFFTAEEIAALGKIR